MPREYKYRSRKRCWDIVISQYNNIWWLLGLTPWPLHHRVAYAMQRNTHTGPSLHGFHIWSDDVILCARPKTLPMAENQASVSHSQQSTGIRFLLINPETTAFLSTLAGFFLCWLTSSRTSKCGLSIVVAAGVNIGARDLSNPGQVKPMT